MKFTPTHLARCLSTLALVTCATSLWADPIWHCSRTGNTDAQHVADASEQFSLASMSPAPDVIGVSIRDLIDIYSGVPVRVGDLPLSACFMPGQDALSLAALQSLGLQPSAIQALARKSAIVQSNLHLVTDEQQMRTCMSRHFPAVGYLSKPVDTEKFLPCF
jgi:hypothetical protein